MRLASEKFGLTWPVEGFKNCCPAIILEATGKNLRPRMLRLGVGVVVIPPVHPLCRSDFSPTRPPRSPTKSPIHPASTKKPASKIPRLSRQIPHRPSPAPNPPSVIPNLASFFLRLSSPGAIPPRKIPPRKQKIPKPCRKIPFSRRGSAKSQFSRIRRQLINPESARGCPNLELINCSAVFLDKAASD